MSVLISEPFGSKIQRKDECRHLIYLFAFT